MSLIRYLLFFFVSITIVGQLARAQTIDRVISNGFFTCGVNKDELLGFAKINSNGVWEGLDVDICLAVAAALSSETEVTVKFYPVSTAERFQRLVIGEIDILSRNTTHNLYRESASGITFPYYNYIDAQGFLYNSTIIKNDKALDIFLNSQEPYYDICTESRTTSLQNIKRKFPNLSKKIIEVNSRKKLIERLISEDCLVVTGDKSQLYAIRAEIENEKYNPSLGNSINSNTHAYNISKNSKHQISKEPLGPAVRQDDPEWARLIRWVIYIMLNAEELEIAKSNIDDLLAEKSLLNIEQKILLGEEGNIGNFLNLDDRWAYRVIRKVGNYDESFERNIENNLQINRSDMAAPLYAPPIGIPEDQGYVELSLYEVDTWELNVRGMKNTNNDPLFQISKGDRVSVISHGHVWKRIEILSGLHEGKTGWVDGRYLTRATN